MGIKRVFRNVKTIHPYHAYLTYRDLKKVYGRKVAHKAFINRINGRPLFKGVSFIDVRRFNNNAEILKNGDEIYKRQQLEEIDNDNFGKQLTLILYLYNPEKVTLDSILNSIEEQLYQNFDLVVVDDDSFSKLYFDKIEESFKGKKGFTFIKNKNHEGKFKTINKLAKTTQTPYIFPIFSNTYLDKTATYYFSKAAKNNASIIYSDWVLKDIGEEERIADFYFLRNVNSLELLFKDYLPESIVYKKDLVLNSPFAEREEIDSRYRTILSAVNKNETIYHVERILTGITHNVSLAFGVNRVSERITRETNVANEIFETAETYFYTDGGARKLALKRNYNPKASIIIAVSNLVDLERTILAINMNSSYKQYEIICVATKELCKVINSKISFKQDNLLIIECKHGDSIDTKFRIGANKATGDYLFLMPSLVLPATAGWIDTMIADLHLHNAAMVSPLTISEGNLVYDAGYMYDKKEGLSFLFQGLDIPTFLINARYPNYPFGVTASSKYIVGIKKEVYLNTPVIEGDNEIYNVLLSIKMNKEGKTCLCDPAVQFVIPHLEFHRFPFSKYNQAILKECLNDYVNDPFVTKSYNNYFYLEDYEDEKEEDKLSLEEYILHPNKNKKKFKKSYKDNEDFFERLKLLLEGRKDNKKTIAYIYPQIENKGTFRYRVFNVCESLYQSKKYLATFFYSNELGILVDFLDYIDVLVCTRYGDEVVFSKFMEEARDLRKKIVFDIDDVVYDPEYILDIVTEMGLDQHFLDGWVHGAGRFTVTGNQAIAASSTNRFLAEKMHEYFGYPVFVIPNSLNVAQIEVDVSDIQKPKDKFIMGYFSGSKTHQTDFNMIVPVILEFLKTHKDAYLEVVGELNIPKELKTVKDQIIYKKRMSLVELQKEIASVNLNIVPLIDTDFNSSKSELKFYEASIVYTPTLASPTFTYKRAIEDGVNGFLAKDNDEWKTKLEYIYQSRNKLNNIAKTAYLYSKTNYLNLNMLPSIERMFDSILDNKLDQGVVDYPFIDSKDLKEDNSKKTSGFPIKWNIHC